MQFQNQDSNYLDFHFNQGPNSNNGETSSEACTQFSAKSNAPAVQVYNNTLTPQYRLPQGSYSTLHGTHFGAYASFPASPGNFLSSPTTHGGCTNVVGSPLVHFAGCSSSREAHS
ncbi:hypothetical protein V6N12_028484 [Hibiscus sabdariffa]|uniref:Uncharacterized protein n=1 Tax=Hibiscus sabdariffa TaxID=183260 RepID=A0ABR2F622_9ROSI